MDRTSREGETARERKRERNTTHTTICLRPRRGLRMNLRVRRVTGVSTSAIFAIWVMLRLVDLAKLVVGRMAGSKIDFLWWWCFLTRLKSEVESLRHGADRLVEF